MTISSPVIETNGLTLDFRNLRAVDNLNLSVPKGIIFGFLGPNGAGKTSTIHLLLGLYEISSGSAKVLGYDCRTESGSIRANTGVLLEHTGLYERLSAEDNLEFYSRLCKIPSKRRESRIREVLSGLGLWERRGEKVEKFSRGMKQKLAVARAILHNPPLLFLDEPTAGLDPRAAAQLREDLLHLTSEGTTVFLTTHNLDEAQKFCCMVGVINHGKLVALGHPDEIRAGYEEKNVEIHGKGFTENILAKLRELKTVQSVGISNTGTITLKLKPNTKASAAVTLIVENKGEVEEVRVTRPSLEDAFLDLLNEEK